MTYSTTYFAGPDIYSRLFCARDERTAFRSVLLTALILLPFAFILAYLGVYTASHYPRVDPSKELALVFMMIRLLPPWGVALMLAALLSAVMSSADTTLLTASSIAAQLFQFDLEKKKSIAVTRIIVILLGGISILIALAVTSIIQSLLLALTVFSGAFVIPTAAGLSGFRCSRQRIRWAVISGGSAALAGKLLAVSGYSTAGNSVILLAFLLNAGFLFLPFKKKN
jgi:SSS family solute:Na+ symporter